MIKIFLKRQKLIESKILAFLFCTFFTSCHKQPINRMERTDYSFLVAGHTYGYPMSKNRGIDPPFVSSFSNLNNKNLDFGIFTGDVVRKSNKEYWDATLNDIKKLNFPIHIAPGNHDRNKEFKNRFQFYYHFLSNSDLFIILSPKKWNIDGSQLEFLKSTIQNNKHLVNNIFIFCHELVWWSPDNSFQNIKINYLPNYPGSSNYWQEVHPFLKTINKNIVLFAGDLGATKNVSNFAFDKRDNIYFIASGMGDEARDQFLIVDVNKGVPEMKVFNNQKGSPQLKESFYLK